MSNIILKRNHSVMTFSSVYVPGSLTDCSDPENKIIAFLFSLELLFVSTHICTSVPKVGRDKQKTGHTEGISHFCINVGSVKLLHSCTIMKLVFISLLTP